MDCALRSQAQQLIEKMKSNQEVLQNSFGFKSMKPNSCQFPDRLTVSESGSGDMIKAKEVLKSKVKSGVPVTRVSKVQKNSATTERLTIKQGTVNIEDMKTDKEMENLEMACQKSEQDTNNSALDSMGSPLPRFKSHKSTTPTSVRKRRDLIDRNVKVDKSLFESERDKFRLLSDRLIPHSDFNNGDSEIPTSNGYSSDQILNAREHLNEPVRLTDDRQRSFYSNLTHEGNDRREANFVRETAHIYKPKSILNTTGSNGSKKRNGNSSNGKVSFHDSRHEHPSQSFPVDRTSKQLLGYDWIAGILDNDPTVMNQSETFFDDIVEFRRVNRDDCVHKTFMDDRLSIGGDNEPLTVKRALEKKVKPFTINDRLFTVPVNNDWLASYVGEQTEDTVENKEPSYDAPRFVRVSIPRSTLVSAHRYKPHRRRSFDPTDSMALGEHCLLGWESAMPATLPTASNIALKDASKGVKTKIATTLEEAEKIAASFYWPDSSPTPGEYTNHRLAKDAILQLRYSSLLDKAQGKGGNPHLNRTTGEMPILSSSENDRNMYRVPRQTKCSNQSSFDKSSTDKILDSTYSLMYEMQRMKEEMDVKLKQNKIPVM